jgi:hypothetical protein
MAHADVIAQPEDLKVEALASAPGWQLLPGRLHRHGPARPSTRHVASRRFAQASRSQRAMVAAKIATLKLGDNQHRKQDAQICAPSQSKAAGMLNVGRRSVQHARTVLDKGQPELQKAVEQGRLSVFAAPARWTRGYKVALQGHASRNARAATCTNGCVSSPGWLSAYVITTLRVSRSMNACSGTSKHAGSSK